MAWWQGRVSTGSLSCRDTGRDLRTVRSPQRQLEIRALDVADTALRVTAAPLDSAQTGDLLLQVVELRGGLAGVSEAGLPLPGLRRLDVDVMRRCELHRVHAVRDLVVIEGETPPHPQPGVVDQHR